MCSIGREQTCKNGCTNLKGEGQSGITALGHGTELTEIPAGVDRRSIRRSFQLEYTNEPGCNPIFKKAVELFKFGYNLKSNEIGTGELHLFLSRFTFDDMVISILKRVVVYPSLSTSTTTQYRNLHRTVSIFGECKLHILLYEM